MSRECSLVGRLMFRDCPLGFRLLNRDCQFGSRIQYLSWAFRPRLLLPARVRLVTGKCTWTVRSNPGYFTWTVYLVPSYCTGTNCQMFNEIKKILLIHLILHLLCMFYLHKTENLYSQMISVSHNISFNRRAFAAAGIEAIKAIAFIAELLEGQWGDATEWKAVA